MYFTSSVFAELLQLRANIFARKSPFACKRISAYRANRPTIRQAEASVFPSFFQSAEKLIIFLFEFSLPGT